MLSASDSYYDLPLYPRLNPASRHDSISLLASLNEFLQRSTLPAIDRILLDAAHDAMAIYELLKYLNIEPFTYLTLAPSVILALIAISKFHLKELLFVLPIWR